MEPGDPTSGGGGEPPDPGDDPQERGRFERLVLPLIRNELFLPVMAVIAGNLAFAVAIVLVYLIRDRVYLLALAVGAMVYGSVKLVRIEIRDAGKAGPLLVWLVIVWIVGGVLTWALFDWL